MEKSNPFKYRGALKQGELFVNRSEILDKLADDVRRAQPVAIYGERQIGKTSLLFRLQEKLEAEKQPVLYLSLEETESERVFWGRLARFLKVQEWDSPIDLLDAVKSAPILLLDEFDKAAFSDQFSADFFSTLRAWGNRSAVKLIIASKRSETELMSETDVTSSFYNIFYNYKLEPFEKIAAFELLGHLESKCADWEDGWKEKAFQTIGGEPWKLQHFCFLAWEALSANKKWTLTQALSQYHNEERAPQRKSPDVQQPSPVARTERKGIPAQAAWALLAFGSFTALGGLWLESTVLMSVGVLFLMLSAVAVLWMKK